MNYYCLPACLGRQVMNYCAVLHFAEVPKMKILEKEKQAKN